METDQGKYIRDFLERRTSILCNWKTIDAFLWIDSQTLIYSDISKNGKLSTPKVIQLKGSKLHIVVYDNAVFVKELFAIETAKGETYIFRTENSEQKIKWIKAYNRSIELSTIIR